ncbi:MAG TPA: histidine phosphatase family protein [Dongiaceae bacterium]|nr:histidine phosphatase family protein [Dongiaceae bacterium]
MAALYLIRHGQASFGSANYDALSERGHQQARVLGESLVQRGIRFDAAFAGTMQRHTQTAEGCLGAMQCDLPLIQLPEFNEYNHEEVFARHRPELEDKEQFAQFLAQSGDPHKAFQKEFEKAMLRWRSGDFDDEYSESWPAFRARNIAAVDAARRHGAKSIAVFSSGGPISNITGHCLGLDGDQSVGLGWAIMNCSITCLLFTADKISLRYFNDFSHFEIRADKSLVTHR